MKSDDFDLVGDVFGMWALALIFVAFFGWAMMVATGDERESIPETSETTEAR